MSLNLNTVQLAGRITREPVLRGIAGDKTVADFGLAINRRFKGSDGELKEDVTFVDIECWGRTAELVGQYMNKGTAIFIEGRLKLDTWQDKEGQKRTKIKVVAESVQFTESKNSNGQAAPKQSTAAVDPITDGDEPIASRARKPAPAGKAATDDEPPF